MSIGTVVAPTLSRRDGGDAVAKDPSRRRRIGGRLWGLDAVRAVATLLVIVIHCDHWPLQSSGADLAVWGGVDTVARVAVPLFVLLSGHATRAPGRGEKWGDGQVWRGSGPALN